MNAGPLDRRQFLRLSGSGVFVLFSLDAIPWVSGETQEPKRPPARQGYPTDFNAYLRIG